MSCGRGGRVAAAALCLALCACHTIRFDLSHDPVAGDPIEDRKDFYWWALYPTMRVDVSQFCPQGALRVVEENAFTDIVLSGFTLGIYTPRTSFYFCRELPPAPPAGQDGLK